MTLALTPEESAARIRRGSPEVRPMNPLTMPLREKQVPARQGHLGTCGHWCFCIDAAGHVGSGGPCRKCRRDAFNDERRADAEWLADYDAAFRATS